MNIFVSFMNIYDHSQREAQNHLWTFMLHWWSFLTKKPRSETFKKIFDSLMDIYDQKKKNIHASLWLKTATKTIHKRVGSVRVFV